MPVVEAPSLAHELGIGHGATALLLLVGPMIAGALLEARLLLWAERGDARRWIAASQTVLAGCLLASTVAPSAPWIGLAFALSSPASGVACALAEGCLVETFAGGRERAMARWMLAGALGDLAAPALVSLVAVIGLGWRTASALVACALVAAAIGVLHGPRLFQADTGDDDDDGGPDDDAPPAMRRARLRDVLSRPALLLWLAGSTTCSLLDETFVLLASSWLRESLGATVSTGALSIGLWATGSATGAFLTERLLRRFSPRTVLAGGALLSIVACLGWLAAPSIAWAAGGLFLVGLAAAPQWPIATARAYATCPGRPALVGAAETMFVPLEIALMAGAGHLADVAGTRFALILLVVQPVFLLILATLLLRPGRPSGTDWHAPSSKDQRKPGGTPLA